MSIATEISEMFTEAVPDIVDALFILWGDIVEDSMADLRVSKGKGKTILTMDSTTDDAPENQAAFKKGAIPILNKAKIPYKIIGDRLIIG